MPSSGFWRYENRLIAVLCLMFGFVFFDRNAMTNLSTFVAPDLHLNNTQIGMLSSALSLAWSLSGFFVSSLSDALGRRKSFLLAAILVFSVCSVISGLAPSFLVLLASRFLMGLAEGPILPIAQSLVVLESADSRRGLNMGVMQNLGSNLIGSFFAPLVLIAVAQAYNWRYSFFLAAIPGLICAFLVWKMVREPQSHEIAATSVELAAHDTTVANEPARMSQLFRYRNIWLCMAISCFMVPWMIVGWTFLPTLYVNYRHIAPSDMSWLMSVLGISAAVFAFIVPGLSDRLGRKPVMIGFNLIGVLYPLAALYYQGPLPLLALLIFIGWSASGTFPVFMATIPSETVPARYLATSLGLVMGLGEFLGGTSVPTLAGSAADHYGLAAPMFIASGCALIGGLLALFLRETAPAKVGAAGLAGERAVLSP
jgi:predicted MFS family arabinose efflux permease